MIDDYSNIIIQGDCIKLMRAMPDNSVDVAFADPPFNLRKGYKSYKDSLEFKEYIEWCEEWLFEMVRVTKPTGSIFVHNIPKWLVYFASILNKYADFKHWIAWDAPTSPMGKSLQPGHYGILYYAKNNKELKFYEIRSPHKRARKSNILAKDYGGKKGMLHPYGPLVSDVWSDIHRIKHNKFRDEHPCQLPIHLLERIILMSSDEGDTILDPFNGTGTTAIAAKRLGRKFIGLDIDESYVKISLDKLLMVQSNSKIGDSWVSFYLDDVVTIRNNDWDVLKEFFMIPENIVDVDKSQIILKTKVNIRTPKKSNLQTIGIEPKANIQQFLFEPKTKYSEK